MKNCLSNFNDIYKYIKIYFIKNRLSWKMGAFSDNFGNVGRNILWDDMPVELRAVAMR